MNKLSKKHSPDVQGATALDHSRWVQLKINGRQSTWIPLSSFLDNGMAAKRLLAEQNIVLLKADFIGVMELVSDLTAFPDRVLAKRSGWVSNCFALSSGQIIGDTGSLEPGVTFPISKRSHCTRGKLKHWKRYVAQPLADQRLPSFALMVPFTAPLLRLIEHPTNFGFELSGPGGVGKTTLCQLAASVMGPMDDIIISMNSTSNAIDQLMSDFNDHPMILEEWNMFSLQAGKHVGQDTAKLTFSLGFGTSKRRHNQAVPDRARFVWLISSNRPFPGTLDSMQRDTAEAAMDRMISLVIDRDRQFGVFDAVNAEFENASEMAASLVRTAGQHYGTPIVKYLEALTKASAQNRNKLQSYVLKRRQMFVDEVKGQGHNAMSDRVAEAFGLVFAAGELAKYCKVLPASFDCMEAAKHAYGMHLESRRDAATPVERLLALLDCPDLLDLRDRDKANKKEIKRASALLWSSSGNDELLLTRRQLLELAPDPSRFLKNEGIRQAMVREDNRNQVYRYTREDSERERYFCFRLGLLQDHGHW